MSLRARLTTVVTTATDTNLVDLDTVKDELNVKDMASNAFLTRQIKSASAAAASFCNRVFAVETITDEFWPSRSDPNVESLQLTRFPAIAVSSVVEDGTTLVALTDYRVDLAAAQLIRLDTEPYPRSWPSEPVAATYTTGYSAIPDDVIDAVIRMVKSRWFARSRDPMLRSESIAGVRDVQYWIATGEDGGAMSPDVIDLLNNYRVPVIG